MSIISIAKGTVDKGKVEGVKLGAETGAVVRYRLKTYAFKKL